MKQNKLRFGPYHRFPMVSISYKSETSELVRVINYEEREPAIKKEKPKMTPKQFIAYLFFLYNPNREESEPTKKTEHKTEVLTKGVSSYEIIQEKDGYYIYAR